MTDILDHETGELVDAAAPEPGFTLLDPYLPPGQVAAPRVDWIATVSAGKKTAAKDGRPIPTVSRDGTIELHDPNGRAPALAGLLAESGGQTLTIALTSNQLEDVLHQRYVIYSATAIEAFGDGAQITEIRDGVRVTHPRGTAEFERLRSNSKVSWSLFFVAARWVGQRAEMVWPDGFGHYRLRSASRNSLYAVVAKLQEIAALTGGRLAGIPLTLRIEQREVAGPDGKRRAVPVWALELKPPAAIQLTSGNFGSLIGAALEAGAAIRLLAPPVESLDQVLEDLEAEADLPPAGEGSALPPPAAAVTRAQTSDVACDAEHYRRVWFTIVRGTSFESDEARAGFVRAYTRGRTASLAEFLASATEAEASHLILTVGERIHESTRATRAAKLEELDPPPAWFDRPQTEADVPPPDWGDDDQGEAPAIVEPPGARPADEAQLAQLRRTLPPSELGRLDLERLTYDEAVDLITSHTPTRSRS